MRKRKHGSTGNQLQDDRFKPNDDNMLSTNGPVWGQVCSFSPCQAAPSQLQAVSSQALAAQRSPPFLRSLFGRSLRSVSAALLSALLCLGSLSHFVFCKLSALPLLLMESWPGLQQGSSPCVVTGTALRHQVETNLGFSSFVSCLSGITVLGSPESSVLQTVVSYILLLVCLFPVRR